jgi:drug/metabolite transporter (DMT)-like permease
MSVFVVYLLVTATAIFWGANFVLAGPILAVLSPQWAAALRFVLGALLMFAISGMRREDLFGLLHRNAAAYLLLGFVGITVFNLLFFYGLQTTSANNAALIMALNPLLTTLLAAVFLGEKPGVRHLIALPVALLGVAVVISQGSLHKLLALHIAHGDLLILFASFSWAIYNVMVKRYMPKGSSMVNTTWILAAGATLLTCIAIGSGGHIGTPDLKAGIAMAVMVLGGTVLAYLFWGIGIERLGAARTAIFLNLVPVSAMLIGAALGTPPTAAQLIGGLLVVGAISITMIPQRRRAVA